MSGGTRRDRGERNMSDDVELTPEEKRQFESLPRDASPSEFVWKRIVRALREDGTMRSAAGATGLAAGSPEAAAGTLGIPVSHWRGEVPGRRVRPWVVAAASMAASLILFGSGLLLGQWMGATSTQRAFLAAREQDGAQLAQRVQEAGTAYVAALVALGELRAAAAPSTSGGRAVSSAQVASEIQQGREAALGALYGAAMELARVTPGDPDIARILQVLQERRFPGTGVGGARQTVWY